MLAWLIEKSDYCVFTMNRITLYDETNVSVLTIEIHFFSKVCR